MGHTPEPTRLRLELGRKLRSHRKAAGLTARQAAGVIEASEPKISRIETGKASLKRIEIEALLRAYGADDDSITKLLALMEEAKKPDWWEDESAVVPVGLGTLFNVETAAKALRTVSSTIIFGMLQTEAYAHAIISAHCPNEPEDVVVRRVRLRMKRQQLLDRDEPPEVTAIIDECALRRVVGSPAIMREQIAHLVEAGRRPHITIRVIPFSAGAHRGQMGSFLWLTFPEDDDPDVVYSDSLTGNIYITKADEVAHFATTFADLEPLSLSPSDSEHYLRRILEEYAS
ncbi:helix-turn-helix domain-containing protein [Streptodolium elevatio]